MIDDLRKLKKLLNEGLISQVDYDNAKHSLLNKNSFSTNSLNHNGKDLRSLSPAENSKTDKQQNIPHAQIIEMDQEISSTSGSDATVVSAESVPQQAHSFSKKGNIIIAILAITLIISCLGMFYFYSQSNTLNTQLEEKKSQIAKDSEEISKLEKEKSRLNGLLLTIDQFLSSEDAGRASKNYYASEKIIFLRTSDGETSFSVTCNYNRQYTAYLQLDNNKYATCRWDGQFDANNVVKVIVSPMQPGIETVTFTNDVSDESFRVLICVY